MISVSVGYGTIYIVGIRNLKTNKYKIFQFDNYTEAIDNFLRWETKVIGKDFQTVFSEVRNLEDFKTKHPAFS